MEICDNGLDDDKNGNTDCQDSACSSTSLCQAAQEICDNDKDDDGDGKVDCKDTDCEGSLSCPLPPAVRFAEQSTMWSLPDGMGDPEYGGYWQLAGQTFGGEDGGKPT